MIVGPILGSPSRYEPPGSFMGAIKSARPPGTVGPGGEPPKSVRLIGRYCLLAEPLCKQGKIQPPVGSFYLVLEYLLCSRLIVI